MVRLRGRSPGRHDGADARVGLVLYDMRNSRGEVEKVLRERSRR
jgi:hypothetical protein